MGWNNVALCRNAGVVATAFARWKSGFSQISLKNYSRLITAIRPALLAAAAAEAAGQQPPPPRSTRQAA